MKKAIGQCDTKTDKTVKAIVSYNTHLKCFNSGLTWQKALHDIENINWDKNVSIDKILFYPNLIKETFYINTDPINKEKAIEDFILKLLLQYFPVIELNRGNHSVLIDSVKMLLDSLIFEILLTFNDPK